MKKSLAVICAVAILLSSLAGTFMFASANGDEYSSAIMPGFATNYGNGEALTLTIGEDLPADVLRKGNTSTSIGKAVANTSNLPFNCLFGFDSEDDNPSGWSSLYNIYLDSNSIAGKGYLYYVEAPASTPFNITTYGAYNGNSIYRQGNAKMYTLEKGDSEWAERAINNYAVELQAGFKGYVYVPFHILTRNNYTNESLVSAGDLIDGAFYFLNQTINEGEQLVFSAPAIVSGTPGDTTLPSVNGVTVGGVNYDFFAEPVNTLDGSEVVFPTYNGVTLVGGEASVPTTVVAGGAVNSVKNTADLPFSNLFEITNAYQTASAYRDIKITPTAGKGAIIYVDAPSIDDILRLGVYVIHENGTAYRYGNGNNYDWFALEEGDTEWKVADVLNYGVDVSGFKGYIYIPFVRLNQNASGIVTTGSKITAIRVYNEIGTIPAGKSLKISAPIIVKGDVDANIAAPALPDAKQVNDGTNVYNYFVEKKTQFGANEVMIVNPSKFEGELVVGQNAPTTVVAAPVTGVAHEVVANVGGVTALPDVKVSKAVTGETAVVAFNKMDKAASRGSVGFMNYFKLSDEVRKFKLTVKAYDAAGADIDAFIYSGKAWTLADGETVWTELPINNYYFELPANFSGYVKFSYADSTFAAGNGDFADLDYLSNVNYLTDDVIAPEKAVTIGMPVHIYQDADTNICMIGKALDMSTGETAGQITGPGTTSSEEASSEESSSAESSSEESSSAESSSEESSSAESSSEESSSDVTSDTSSEEDNDFVAPSGITNIFNPAGSAQISQVQGATATLTEVDSRIPVTVNKSVKVEGHTTGTVAQYKYADTTEKAIGVMFYLDTELANPYVKIATGAYVYGANNVEDGTYKWPSTSYQYGSMYYLAEGDTEWKQTPDALNSGVKYFRQIPAPNGFKGYVYMPFNSTVTDNVKCESAVVEYAYLQLETNEATAPVYLSSYMLVKEFYADSAYATVDNKKCINMFDGTVYVPQESSSSEESSSDNGSSDITSSDDTSSGGNTPSNPDDYKVPAYTGEAIDYTGINIQNVTIGKLNDTVTVGSAVSTSAANPGKNNTIVAVASKIGITKYPSFKLNSTSVNFNLDKAVAPKNPAEVMYYIELPAGKGATTQITWNFYNAEGEAYYNTIYSGTAYLLANGSELWENTAISAYNFDLPAGFKGYVKFDVTKINSQANSPAGDKATFLADTEKYLNNTAITFTGIEVTDDVYLSAPIFVTKASTENGNVAFVDGETNAARNLFSGEVVKRSELDINDTSSDDTSSDDTSSGGNTPSDPGDYRVPAYTGPAINYDKIDIMSATVGKLNGPISAGSDLEGTGAATIEGGNIEAIASKIGITRYPSFKFNVKTGEAKFNDMAPAVAYLTQEKNASPKNPSELMYYIEVPSINASYASFNWTFGNKDGAYYVNMYSGNCQIMPVGESDWIDLAVSYYQFKLPAGFKGYIKFNLKDLTISSGSPAYASALRNGTTTSSAKEYFLADTTKYLEYSAFGVENVTADMDVIVSAPIIVTDSGLVTHVAYVDGEKVARNIFTGDVATREDLKNYIGLIDTEDPNAVQPEYKLPAYTGAEINYNDLDIMKATVGKLNGVVVIGSKVSSKSATVAAGGKIAAIASPIGITKYASFKINATTAKAPFDSTAPTLVTLKQDTNVSPKNPADLMYYIETANAEETLVSFNWTFTSGNGQPYYANMYSGNCYIMQEGESKWSPVEISYYKFKLPANFKGYVKFTVNDINVSANSPAYGYEVYNENTTAKSAREFFKQDETKYLSDTTFGVSEAKASQNIIVSAPIIVTDTGVVPNYAFIDGDLKAARNLFTGNVASRDDLKDYIGYDDGSDAPSEPSDPSAPAGQPNYKVDPYTGAAIDYSKLSIQNITVGKLNDVVTVGKAVPRSAASAGKEELLAAVESRIGITKYPSFKLNGTSVTFSLDAAVSPLNPTEVMYYIELPAGKGATTMVTWNFYNEAGLAYYNIMYNGTVSLMAEGADEWTNTQVSAYNFKLPEGFKGYIKFNVNNIRAQENSPAGNGEVFKADTKKYLSGTTIKFSSGIEATDTVYVSTPILVTKGGSVPFAAFVDGETNAARNILTGKVLSRNDLKDFIGVEGNENLNTGEAPEINYNIPKYTGAKYEYGNYEFARVRQFVLAGNIAKGYVVPQEVFSDGHPDKNNDYTKLIDTTIGISKMPLFSITKTTGQPNNTEKIPVSLGTWHPNSKVASNAGPGAIMQYIKLPSGLEKPFLQLTMNFFDKDNMTKNVAPYNGVIYYMQKGTNEWVSGKITAYWFELPQNFEGYIMIETKALKCQAGGGDFAADWQMTNYNLNVANLNNQTVVASAPFWVEKMGDIDYACYLNDEQNAVRDIFTGKILKKEDVIKPLKIGDTLVKLPDYTTDFSASIANKDALSSGTAEVEWDSIDNAVKYVVRVFKKINTDDGIAYNFVAEAETDGTSVTINDLELNTQYAIVVYAYDAKDNEIAVFDYINASTAGGAANAPSNKPTTPSTPSAPEEEGINWLLIGLIIGGVVVLAGIAVAVIIILKKRKAKVAVGDEVLNSAEVDADVNVDTETPPETDTEA